MLNTGASSLIRRLQAFHLAGSSNTMGHNAVVSVLGLRMLCFQYTSWSNRLSYQRTRIAGG